MKVFEALLVKACGPLSFVLLILWSQDAAHDDKTTINILLTFVITYAFWWLIYRQNHGNRRLDSLLYTQGTLGVYSSFMFFANFAVIYRALGNEQQRRFITDHAIPFMDLISIYNCITHELWCVFYFLYNYARYFEITAMKGIMLLVYLLIQAGFLLMTLDFAYTTAIASVQIFLTENFVDSYDANLTRDYPIGYIEMVELDKDQNYEAFVREIYVKNIDGKFTLESSTKEMYKDSSETYLPYRNISLLRYIGEDVEISCSYLYTNTSQFTTIWLKDGKQLAKSNRRTINLNVSRDETEENRQRYSVTSKLKIHLLKENDFGKYECVSMNSEIRKTNSLYGKLKIKELYVIRVYHIGELKQELKLMHRNVGNLIRSVGYFYYHAFQTDDVSVQYTINGRPISDVCGGYITQVCSIGSKLHSLFDSFNINRISDERLPLLYAHPYEDLDIHSAVIWFCMCQHGYGIHRTSFQRNVYLKSRNRSKILEFEHPFIVIILPHTRMSLFRYFDDQYLYKDIEKYISNGTDLDIIERKINDLLNFISANEEKVFSFANLVQILVSVTSLIFSSLLITMFINFYFERFIRIPIRRYILLPLPCNQQRLRVMYQEFDVIISHSDAELSFVSTVLVPFLEQECHLHVCIPDRDFHPGKSIFRLYADAFTKSRKIIVVLSLKYMSDPQCSALQLEHLILPMIYEDRKGKHDVLFIKYDEKCRLPEPLRWNFDIDVLPWTTEPETVLKLKRIRQWYLTGTI